MADRALSVAVGISGASGAIYGVRTLLHLAAAPSVGEIRLVVTDAGQRVLVEEMGLSRTGLHDMLRAELGERVEKVVVLPNGDIGASLASGSTAPAGMAIVPCSMATVGALAAGLATTLLRRGADVMLKERRPLVLVPREAPFNLIHLENLARLVRAGAHVVPAAPGFYHQPTTIEQLVDQIVAKVLDLLGVPHGIDARYLKDRPRSV